MHLDITTMTLAFLWRGITNDFWSSSCGLSSKLVQSFILVDRVVKKVRENVHNVIPNELLGNKKFIIGMGLKMCFIETIC